MPGVVRPAERRPPVALRRGAGLCFLAGANSVFLGDRLLTTPNPGVTHDRAAPGSSGHAADHWRRGGALQQCDGIIRSSSGFAPVLAALGANGLLRTLREPAGIDLSSNDYLNLSTHPVLATRFIEGVVREGCGSTGSRLLRGERACFAAVERRFARFKRAERALYFSTGLPGQHRCADDAGRVRRRDLLGRVAITPA